MQIIRSLLLENLEYMRSEKKEVTSRKMDEIMKVAERFYEYASNVRPGFSAVRNNLVGEVPVVTEDEVANALKCMKGGKAAGHDVIAVNLLKDGGNIILKKLAKLFSDCLRTLKVPLA